VTAYVDTSVLLRVALGQADALPEWRQIDRGVTSALARVEGLRTLDRLRLRARLGDAEVARRRAIILQLLDSLELVEVDSLVLDRAAQPQPTELGTLDAIHLATALLWRETMHGQLIMATHDVALATAAQAHGFRVVGVQSGR
jgi:predicted nucleic acid-binding protein